MSKFTFNLPDIGEGIAEAEIVEWHIKPGDMVEEDGRLADMMTDKATVEMESPVSGKVLEVAGEVGDTIAIGSMLVVIEIEGDVSDDVLEDNTASQGADNPEAQSASGRAAPGQKDKKLEERIEVENPDASDADDAIAAGDRRADGTGSAQTSVPTDKKEDSSTILEAAGQSSSQPRSAQTRSRSRY